MKHDAWRQDPAQYPCTFDIAPRYADVDTLRHLNNSALHVLHQEARMRFLVDRIGDTFWRGRGPRLLAARATTDFLLESHYPDTLTVGVRVTALDEHRLVLGTALFQNGRCTGLQATELQASERGLRRPLPDDWRLRLDPGALPPAGEAQAEGHAPVWAQFAKTRDLDSRYNDLDATGRVSEGALMRCGEQGRSALLRGAFAALPADGAERAWLGLLVARVDLHVLRAAPAPARWRLGTGVSHLGRSSVVLRTGLFDADLACHAYADSVLVFVNRQAGGSTAMPEAMRALLEQQRLAS